MTEIVTEAFNAAGESVNIVFHPAKRAIYGTRFGKFAGVYPITFDSALEEDFLFSSPIPGMNFGLLRNKSTSPEKNFSLRQKTIGIEAGSLPVSIASKYIDSEYQIITTNEQLLQMLYLGRVDYILIDKFTAADLMVDKLPNLIGKLEFVTDSIEPVSFHVGFSKKYPLHLRAFETFEKGLSLITASGKLEDILYSHGLLSYKNGRKKKVLRIATVVNDDMITMKRLSSIYEKAHPDIELDWRLLDESILRRRLLSDLAVADGQYDIMTIGAYETPIWAKNKWITPLTALPERYDMEDLIENVRESLSYKDQLFALPFYGESSITYFRKDLLSRKGLSMPKFPTWNQIMALASKIHDPLNKVYGICLRGKVGWGENMAVVTSMVNAFGGQWFDMKWRTTIDSLEWKKATSFYISILKKYGPPNAHNNGYLESLRLFTNGHCGIWVDATVAASTLFDPKRSQVAGKVGYAPAPSDVAVGGPQWLWIWSLAVPTSSKHQQAAIDFISWATSKEYIQLVAETVGWGAVPPGTRYSTYRNKNYQTASPYAAYVLDEIEKSDPKSPTVKPSPYTGLQFVAIPEYTAVGTYVGEKINLALRGHIKLDKALQEAQSFVSNKMQAAGYHKEKAIE